MKAMCPEMRLSPKPETNFSHRSLAKTFLKFGEKRTFPHTFEFEVHGGL